MLRTLKLKLLGAKSWLIVYTFISNIITYMIIVRVLVSFNLGINLGYYTPRLGMTLIERNHGATEYHIQ